MGELVIEGIVPTPTWVLLLTGYVGKTLDEGLVVVFRGCLCWDYGYVAVCVGFLAGSLWLLSARLRAVGTGLDSGGLPWPFSAGELTQCPTLLGSADFWPL